MNYVVHPLRLVESQVSLNFGGKYNTIYDEYRRDLFPAVVDTKYIGVVLLLACKALLNRDV